MRRRPGTTASRQLPLRHADGGSPVTRTVTPSSRGTDGRPPPRAPGRARFIGGGDGFVRVPCSGRHIPSADARPPASSAADFAPYLKPRRAPVATDCLVVHVLELHAAPVVLNFAHRRCCCRLYVPPLGYPSDPVHRHAAFIDQLDASSSSSPTAMLPPQQTNYNVVLNFPTTLARTHASDFAPWGTNSTLHLIRQKGLTVGHLQSLGVEEDILDIFWQYEWHLPEMEHHAEEVLGKLPKK